MDQKEIKLCLEKLKEKNIEIEKYPAIGGKHKGCSWKGDSRMRNKALAADDHRNEPKPRPALNIDIVRCCVTFDDVESFTKGINELQKHTTKKLLNYVDHSLN